MSVVWYWFVLLMNQVGTVIEPASEYYTGRLTKKERKATIADELLHDTNLAQYRYLFLHMPLTPFAILLFFTNMRNLN